MVKKRYIASLSLILHGAVLFAFASFAPFTSKPRTIKLSFEFKQASQKPNVSKAAIGQNNKDAVAKVSAAKAIPDKCLLLETIDTVAETNIQNVPKIVKYSKPIYPDTAIKKGIEATFEVNLKIDKNGNVKSVHINDHTYLNLFKQSIENALYSWKFDNAEMDKSFDVPVIFKLYT